MEGDLLDISDERDVPAFLSTPSGWRATFLGAFATQEEGISIHALRVEGDNTFEVSAKTTPQISIHALRVEGDFLGDCWAV